MDLAIGNNGTDSVAIFLGFGNGTFGSVTNFVVGQGCKSVVSKDFNGDSKMDLAVGNVYSNNISVLFGLGNGNFTTAGTYSTGLSPWSICSDDFNGDGYLDLAIPNYYSDNISVLLGSITGTFSPAVSFSVSARPCSIASADCNGDGKLDLISSSDYYAEISILLGDGTGIFGTHTTYGIVGSPTFVSPSDFNGDGKIDLAIANSGGPTLLINGEPTISFSSTNTVCVGSNLSLTANGANTYSWSTGAMSSNINVSPFSMTNYTVIGTAIGGCTNIAVATISVITLPAINVITSNSLICFGDTSILMATGANTYSWSTGAIGNTINVSPTSLINYSVTGIDIAGCTNTAVTTINVNTLPVMNIVNGNSVICIGDSSTLMVSGANTYSWSTGTNSNTLTVKPISTLNYTVTGIDVNGCANIAITTISVNALPVISIVSSNSLICIGNSSTLTASGANTYSWNSGSLTDFEIVSPDSTISYIVIGTDVNGCSNSAIITQSVSSCIGIVELNGIDTSLNIYPNPANEILNIDFEVLPENAKVELFNTIGELIQSQILINDHYSININHLNSGIYVLKIIENNKTVSVKKIVKQ